MPTYRMQFSGQDIIRPTAAVTDVMDRWLERHAPPLYTHPGWDTRGLDHLPIPPKPKPRPPRLNVLEWPTGMSRWASFYCLVGSAAFAAIKETLDPLAPVAGQLEIAEVDDEGVATPLVAPRMYAVDVRPVFCSDYAAEREQELFLLTLADVRYFAWYKPLEYDFAACNTWTDLITAVAEAALGLTPDIPTPIDALYDDPWPLRWFRPGVPLPLLADAAASQVGRKWVLSPEAPAKVTLKDVDEALADDQTRWDTYGDRCVAGGYDLSTTNLPGNTPAGWAVGFPGDVQTVVTGSLADLAIAEYGDITGVAGQSVWLRADKRADDADNPLAELMAAEWYKWQLSKTDATFRGILPGLSSSPTGMEDRVEWRYLPPDTDRRTVYQAGTAPTDIPAPGLEIVRDQVLTTVVPVDRADRAMYGDRPPPGYTYSVKVTAVSGDSMAATIRVVDPACPTGSGPAGTEAVTDGPHLGYAEDGLVLYRDPLADRPAVGDVGTAVPDPIVPNRWIFQGTTTARSEADDCIKVFPRRISDCLRVQVIDWEGLCTGTDQEFGAVYSVPDLGWLGDDAVVTPIGSGPLVIYYDTYKDLRAKITVDAVPYYGTLAGCEAADADDENQTPWVAWVFGDDDLCPVSGSAVVPFCEQSRFTVRARCATCTVPIVFCSDPPFDMPRTLCVGWKWNDAFGDPDTYGCAACDGHMTITYGTYDLYIYGAITSVTGWYGEVDNPAGCTYPNGIAGSDGKIHCFMVAGGSYDPFYGRIGGTAGWSTGMPSFGPACPYTPPDPFTYTEGATIWAGTSSCAPSTSGPGAYKIVVSDASGGCSTPTDDNTCCDGDGQSLETHPDVEITIPDGPNAGTYTAAWDGAAYVMIGVTTRFTITCPGGRFVMTNAGTGTSVDSGNQDCDPFSISFPGSVAGGAGNITVIIA